ncbi:hypothetical protein BFP76_11550 [Amylibacter kogurei]|uniref:CAAX prenyl protease 2/Lysostaphin resistance protein A-like domain-containing protein n=1 Tax=Paramylibacter kogurei TaxID=1889778 RepID=A0A2G5KCF5_9RHOB|nr:CPBP family intramembrane glutamic endopeptidase [Amylibacter kogurei]PIB26530.1 hypothetical protein BFP76_11550 [Amylibacter kogurei]
MHISEQSPASRNKASFLSPAKQRNEIWRIVAVLVLGFVVLQLITAVIFVVAGQFMSSDEFLKMTTELKFTTPKMVITVLTTFGGWIVAIIIMLFLFHRRSVFTLLGGNAKSFLRNFVLGILAVIVFFVGSGLLEPSDLLPEANLSYDIWLSWLPIAIPLILMQVSAEELVFRGYIQQQLAVRFDHFAVWMILPSLVFALGHYQPATFGSNAWLVVVQTFLIGVLAADMTMRTGNLGAAIGVHFANNFMGMCIVATKGYMSGLSLYVSPIDLGNVEQMRPLLMSQVGFTAFIVLIYFLAAQRWYRY